MRKSRAVLGLFMAAAVGMTGCSASGEAGAGSTAQTPRQTAFCGLQRTVLRSKTDAMRSERTDL